MSIVTIPHVGVFERISVQAPWGGEEAVRYETISLDPPIPEVVGMRMLLAIVPSFAAGVLIGMAAVV